MKNIYFNAPLHIIEGVKTKEGKIVKKIRFDLFNRLYEFIKSLLPRVEMIEVGAEYDIVRQASYGIGSNGELCKLLEPTYDKDSEKLVSNFSLTIRIDNPMNTE